MLAQRQYYRPDVGPTLGKRTLLSGCKLHTTEPAHNGAAGLCTPRWCAARLCVIR